MKFHLRLILTALMLSMLQSGCQVVESTPAEATRPPLEFTYKDLNGHEVTISSLRGHVVLINFWASWCSPCREEMPLLESFYQAHKENNFIFIAVNVSESANDARAFVEEHGFTFPVWSDPPGNSLIEFGLRGLPASIVLDEDGYRQLVWIGPFNQNYLDELVVPLLQQE